MASANPTVSGRDIITRFLPFLWKDKSFKLRLGIVLALALIPVTIVFNLGLPILFREIINELSDRIKTTESVVLTLIFAYGFFWTFGVIAEKLREMVFFRPIGRAITEYSITVFKHIHTLSLRFHLGRQTGKITTAIEHAQLAIAMVITNILFRIGPTIIELLLAFTIIGYLYGLFYAGLLIGTLITYFSWTLLTTNLLLKRQREWAKVNGLSSARFVDGLFNIETVNYFNRHDYEIETARKLHKVLDSTIIKLMLTTSFVGIVHTGIIGVGLILITYFAGMDVLHHKFRLGDFILINGYVLQFLSPLYELGHRVQETRHFLTEIEPSAELLMEEKRDEKNRLPALRIDKAEISFEKVCFSYLPERQILIDLTFKVAAGSTVAIVGPSGCGKSTIARLILRLFEINSGCIKIDNQNIQTVDPQSIRQVTGVVPQDIALFNNTLRYNLCYGTFDANDQEIDEIVRVTHLDILVKKLPLGLNTPVGERGLKLSGGERQRIALARALLKRPAILIFDEATSSLDVKTEQAIQKNIKSTSKNITTLMIAHRLSTVVDADLILVLNQGNISEQGTHKQLLKQHGLYAALWHKQRFQEAGEQLL